MQQDHWIFLLTETCKSILKINWFTRIFEIGHILLQSVLTGPDATWPYILHYHKYWEHSMNFRNSFQESEGKELFLKPMAKTTRISLFSKAVLCC